MNYWVFITTPDNWKVTNDRNLLGVAKRYKNSLSRVNKGDRCLVYVTEDYTISGEYEVLTSMYFDDSQIFFPVGAKQNELFPLRLKIKSLNPSAEPIGFKKLIPNLSFIKNKEHWGATFQGNALLKIPEQDYKTIVASF